MEDFTADAGAASAAANGQAVGPQPTPPQEQPGVASRRATVRTYRLGPGDSHLVTLHGDGGKTYRILIDGGMAPATKDASAVVGQVMADILAATGGHVDLLVATQDHGDHRSGFVPSADAFAKLDVGEVWLPWTADPNDPAANALRKERERALDKLRLAGAEVQLRGSDAESRAINSLLEFHGISGRASTADPLAAVRATTHAAVYCRPGDAPRELPGVGARIYLLWPPGSEAAVPATHDSAPSDLALGEFLQNVVPNLDGNPVDNPFSTLYSIPEPVARAMPFFQQRYWEDAPWRRIDTAWITDATQYALVLDSVANHTGPGLAIELDGGDVLLFAADGQVGNWSTEGCKVDGHDLLAHTVFYKVGHHGGVNATVGKHGLELMSRLRVAVIPVDHADAQPVSGCDLALEALQRALAAAIEDRGYVLRTDQDAPAVAINRGASATAGYFDVQL
jgi:hypothetical protein